jgi:replication factor A1
MDFFRGFTATLILSNNVSSKRACHNLSDDIVERPRPQAVNVKIGELTPNSKAVNVTAKIVSKGEVRNTTSGRDYQPHRVVDALVGDETGCVYLNLWDDNIDKVKEGDTLNIKNGYVNLFRGNIRLNIGRYGSFEIAAESPIKEVNTENNVSSKQYEQERRYGGGYGGGRRGGYGGGYGGRRGGYGDRRREDYQRRRY